MRMREITSVRTSWGSRRVHVLLRRKGWHVNHKRVRRLYRLEGLNVRSKGPRRRKTTVTRSEVIKATRRTMGMNFMADQLHDGRKIRVLTIVDQHTREAMATEAHGSFSSGNVVEVLNRLSRSHRKPSVI